MAHARAPGRRLTVAITGPTGEIGQAVVAALERSREVGRDPRHGPPAIRPARARLEEGRPTGAATCSTATPSRRWCADADVVVHLAFMIMGGAEESREVNLDRLAQRVRGDRRGRRQAARVRLLGGRLRLPSRQPPAAHRGCSRAGHRRPLLLRPEGRGRGAARDDARRQRAPPATCSARASSPGRRRRC